MDALAIQGGKAADPGQIHRSDQSAAQWPICRQGGDERLECQLDRGLGGQAKRSFPQPAQVQGRVQPPRGGGRIQIQIERHAAALPCRILHIDPAAAPGQPDLRGAGGPGYGQVRFDLARQGRRPEGLQGGQVEAAQAERTFGTLT